MEPAEQTAARSTTLTNVGITNGKNVVPSANEDEGDKGHILALEGGMVNILRWLVRDYEPLKTQSRIGEVNCTPFYEVSCDARSY